MYYKTPKLFVHLCSIFYKINIDTSILNIQVFLYHFIDLFLFMNSRQIEESANYLKTYKTS